MTIDPGQSRPCQIWLRQTYRLGERTLVAVKLASPDGPAGYLETVGRCRAIGHGVIVCPEYKGQIS